MVINRSKDYWGEPVYEIEDGENPIEVMKQIPKGSYIIWDESTRLTQDQIANAIKQGYWFSRYHEESEKLKKKEESGWLTKAIMDRIKNRRLNKKKAEIEEIKLDIEKAKLTKQLKEIRK